MSKTLAGLALIALTLFGCDPDPVPQDAGGRDAGPGETRDAGAGTTDAGQMDGGMPDAGEPDAGLTDAGPTDAGPALSPSEQLALVRAAADGPVDIAIGGAWVTYVLPAFGADPAGFFLQRDAAGPAVFVAVDPTTLTPAPVVGDEVSLRVTSKTTSAGQPRASAISDFAVLSSSNPIASLVQNVDEALDLVTNRGAWADELITVEMAIYDAFAADGTAHVVARVETLGIFNEPNCVLRVPTTLQASLSLAQNCELRVTTPLWVTGDRANLSAWTAADITSLTCP